MARLLAFLVPFVLRGVSLREFSSGMAAGTWEWHRKVAPKNHFDLLALARSGCQASRKKLFWRFWARCVNAARSEFGVAGDQLRDRKTDLVFQRPDEARYFVLHSATVGLYISMLCQGWRFKTSGNTASKFVRFWRELSLDRPLHSDAYVERIGERACILFHRGFTGRQAWFLLVGRKNVLRDAACVTVGASAKATRGARALMRVAHKFGLPRVGFCHFRIRNRDAERLATMSTWGVIAVLADMLASSDEAYENEKRVSAQVVCEYAAAFDKFDRPAGLSFTDVHGDASPFVGSSGALRGTTPIRWEKVAESLKGRGWKVRLLERVAQWSGEGLFNPAARPTERYIYLRNARPTLFTPKPIWFEVLHRENPSTIWEEVGCLLEKGDEGLSLEELRQPLLAKWRKFISENPRGEAGTDQEWRLYVWRLLAAFDGNVKEAASFLKVVGELFVTGERETPWHFAANNFGADALKCRTFLKWGKVWIATRTMPILSDILLVSNKWEEGYGDGRKFEAARSHAAGKLYVGVPEDIARVCSVLKMSQAQASDYVKWLQANPAKDSENIPAPKAASVGGFTVRQLQTDDLLGPLLGVATHCCQHPKGAARDTARQGWVSPNGAFWVVEDPKGALVAMTHVWRNGADVVLDSLEHSSEWQKAVEGGIVGMALKDAARSIVGRLGVFAVYCGAGHTSWSVDIGKSDTDHFGWIDAPAGEAIYRGDSMEVYRMA